MGRPMTALDLAFLAMETPQSPVHVAALQILEIPAGYRGPFARDLYDALRRNTQPQAPFSWRPVLPPERLARPAWEDAARFDIDAHVHLTALAAPGGLDALYALAARLHETPLDRSRPLWDMHVIDGVAEDKIAINFKMHHAIVDGVSGMKLMDDFFTEDAGDRNAPAPWTKVRAAGGTAGPGAVAESMLGRGWDWAAATAKSAAEIGPELGGLFLKQGLQLAGLGDSPAPAVFQAPRSIINQPIGRDRAYGAIDLDLTRVKAVGKALGCTVNDMVLACCSGALRRYLLDRQALPAKSLVATVPVSVRSKSSVSDGNQISYIFCTLGTDRADPLGRVRTIKVSAAAAKDIVGSLSAGSAKAFAGLANSLTAMLKQLHLVERLPPPANVTISNVPGPRNDRFLMGARLLGQYPLSVLVDGQSVNISLLTNKDKLNIGVITCRRAVPDAGRLAHAIAAELDVLEQAAR